jgi:hypothetical protein
VALNEYDEMLKGGQGSAGANGNEYDSMLADQKESQKETLQQSMFVAAKKEPERQGRVLELSKKMNLPPDMVERNFETLEQKARPAAISDYDQFIEKTPGLAKWLEDPNNAAVAQDDIEALSNVERQVRDHGTLSTMYSALNCPSLRYRCPPSKLSCQGV